jgi:hypothetical protein
VLIAFFASSLEDPIFPALLFTVLGVAWVLLRRGELTRPPAPATGPELPATGGAGQLNVPAEPTTGTADLSRARTET